MLEKKETVMSKYRQHDVYDPVVQIAGLGGGLVGSVVAHLINLFIMSTGAVGATPWFAVLVGFVVGGVFAIRHLRNRRKA